LLKIPSVVIYWSDTHELLSHMEMMNLHDNAVAVSVSPLEVLLRDIPSGKMVVVRGITDPAAPRIPGMNYED